MEPEEKIEAAVDTKTVTNKKTKKQKITQSATVEDLAHIRYESHSAEDGQEMLIIAADLGEIKPILQVQPGCGCIAAAVVRSGGVAQNGAHSPKLAEAFKKFILNDIFDAGKVTEDELIGVLEVQRDITKAVEKSNGTLTPAQENALILNMQKIADATKGR